ncbi:MAG: hypothetical protein ACKPEN_15590 [Planktothrix sp.]|uniref:hypothetical protein n=2 Tax=Planktothrix sp. TaxID=3088171 RepID=UPI0038D4F5F0
MPMDRKRYPANWNQIATQIKKKANWYCENCNRPCRKPKEDRFQFEDRIKPTPWADELYQEKYDEELGTVFLSKLTRFTLTVAHLNHTPEDCRPENLKALCSVCHLRYDAAHHIRSAKANRLKKREAVGQLTLF